jgi:type II secretory pathway pseudopilin PulG
MYCQSWNGGTRENIGLSQANQQLLRNCDNTLRSAKLLPGKHISQQPQICNNTLQGGKLMHPTMHWPKQTSQSCDVQSSETFSAPSLDVSTETCLRRLHPTSILTRNEEEIAWVSFYLYVFLRLLSRRLADMKSLRIYSSL